MPLDVLADKIGGMKPGDLMTLTASDGYETKLSYYQIFPEGEDATAIGRIILAYSFNGTATPEWEDGPMVVFLPEDKGFSNEDYNLTAPRDPRFPKSTSGGSVWARNVVSIKVEEVYNEWTIDLIDTDGTITTLTRTDIFRLQFFFPGEFVYENTTYTGVSLSALLGPIQQGAPDTYDQQLYSKNYRLHLNASDGYNKYINIADAVDGDCILATAMDGEDMESRDHPCKVVGQIISKKAWVGSISTITLADPVAV